MLSLKPSTSAQSMARAEASAEEEVSVKRARVALAEATAYTQGLEMEEEEEELEEEEEEEEEVEPYPPAALERERDSVIRMCYGKLHHMSAERIDTCLRKSVLIFNTMRSLQAASLSAHSSPSSGDSDEESHGTYALPASPAPPPFELDDDGGLDYREAGLYQPQASPVSAPLSASAELERRSWWQPQSSHPAMEGDEEEEEEDEESEEEEEDDEEAQDSATMVAGSRLRAGVWLSHEAGAGWSDAGFDEPPAGEMDCDDAAAAAASVLPATPFSTTRSELAKSWSILNPASPPSSASSSPSPPLSFPPPPTHSSFQELVSIFEPTVNS